MRCEITNLEEVPGKVVFSASLDGYSSVFEKSLEVGPNETEYVDVELVFSDGFYEVETIDSA